MKVVDVHPGEYYVPDLATRADGRYPNAVKGIPYLSGETVNHDGSGGEPGDERACIGNQGQACSADLTPLDCIDDYIGGGSHYWHLRCRTCATEYVYDTYRFRLEVWAR